MDSQKQKISLQQLSDGDSSDSDDEDSVASSESIPKRVLFSNTEAANPIDSATMQSPPPSQSLATPMGSGKLFAFVIHLFFSNSMLYCTN
jgi:hypothetical protein